MEKNSKTHRSRHSVNVVIYTVYELMGECVAQLLKVRSGLKICAVANSKAQLVDRVSKIKPDVVLFCLGETCHDLVGDIPEIFELSSETSVLIVTPVDTGFDQTNALRLGASGIVGAHQKEEVLVRAINQVSRGEPWVSQKLIAKLLNPPSEESSLNGEVKNNELTKREQDVIQAIALGLNNKLIAKHLFISEATVRHHLSSIYSKLYVNDRLSLAIYAYQHGIVKPPLSDDL